MDQPTSPHPSFRVKYGMRIAIVLVVLMMLALGWAFASSFAGAFLMGIILLPLIVIMFAGIFVNMIQSRQK